MLFDCLFTMRSSFDIWKTNKFWEVLVTDKRIIWNFFWGWHHMSIISFTTVRISSFSARMYLGTTSPQKIPWQGNPSAWVLADLAIPRLIVICTTTLTKSYIVQYLIMFSRPGRSHGLLYKHLHHELIDYLIHSLIRWEKIFTAPSWPNG